MDHFDVIVIGAGPGGEVVAGRLGANGVSVALVEERLIGGECSFWACMPSKALLRPGEVLAEVRRIPGAAEAVSGMIDVHAALKRRDQVIHDLDDSGMLPWLEERNVTVVRGRGTVTGERTVEVTHEQHGTRTLQATQAVVLATGSKALIPPIDGLRDVHPWTNIEATTADRAPDHLLILGGGVVGVEMAQAWRTLGSQATLVEALPRVLAREEEFASEQVAESLRKRGVKLRLGAKATRAERHSGQVTLHLEDGSAITGDELLVSIGRRPNTQAVEALGYADGKPIEVDDRLRSTRHEWLFAIGDVNGKAVLTHMAKYQARQVADLLLGREVVTDNAADGTCSPRVTFTDPQVAAVGHTLQSARDAGIRATAVDVETSGNAGGSFYGRNATGTARIVVDEDRRVVVGATITGAETAEFLHAATIAVVAEVPLERLWHAVPAFPTRSELWLRLLEGYGL